MGFDGFHAGPLVMADAPTEVRYAPGAGRSGRRRGSGGDGGGGRGRLGQGPWGRGWSGGDGPFRAGAAGLTGVDGLFQFALVKIEGLGA